MLVIWIKARNISAFSGDWILIFYTVFVTTFQISRIVSALFFKKSLARVLSDLPLDMQRARYEPMVTFVVPCKNEEAAIKNTVTQCFKADYPKDKIEVIVINDGSTDRTQEILEETQKVYPNLIIVNWKVNRGKRHGMAEGFARARGEIIVQLDSDSYIKPEYFRKLVEPFKNPTIGGVCAHADPDNADENWMTKMQSAYYFMSFRILKAAESTYGTVFCLSGCSSAYRKSIVSPFMDTWLNEKFLGLPVTWGDDRGLTNYVMKAGYKTIYTDDAKAATIVPTTLRQFIKQQIRWKKGWFVNSFFAGKFIWKTDPFIAFAYFYPLTIVTLLTPFMAARALLYVPFVKNSATLGFYFFGIFLIAGLIILFYRFVARENKYWPYLFIWSGINTVILSFLLFYALATIQNRKWGTR
ncbi:MAG: glycosyltransferase [Candidatus Paceibacterota bacterium]|jgi:hyaluronan synthase